MLFHEWHQRQFCISTHETHREISAYNISFGVCKQKRFILIKKEHAWFFRTRQSLKIRLKENFQNYKQCLLSFSREKKMIKHYVRTISIFFKQRSIFFAHSILTFNNDLLISFWIFSREWIRIILNSNPKIFNSRGYVKKILRFRNC